jgi:transmembrane sensor
MASDLPSKDQLEQYLDGSLPKDDADRIRAYIEAHPGRRGALAGIVASMRGDAFGGLPDRAAARQRFLDRLATEMDTAVTTGPIAQDVVIKSAWPSRANGSSGAHGDQGHPSYGFERSPRHIAARDATSTASRRTWITSAFVFPLLIVVAVTMPWVHASRSAHHGTAISHQYTATRGQRVTVRLADGSTVTLAPETQLRYTVDHDGTRTADLVGEAYFVVASRAHQPFVVRTGAVATRVLGTAFDVRRYPDERVTQVSVISGRVATGGHVTPVVLSAGALGRVTDSSVTVSTLGDPLRAISWTQGHLVFDNVPVPVMLAALGRWYGYEFHLTDTTLAARHVSVAFSADAPTDAMNMVKAVLGVTMTFDGNVVTLQPRGADHHPVSRTSPNPLSRNTEPEVGK